MRTINEILLVEDNETTSFLNVRLLVKMEISDKITVRNNGEKGINYLIDLKKNGDNYLGVIFLDIKMPQGTGFDLLQKLENVNFEVIFVTAYNDYAIKAFQFSAFGYLMKPIRSSELEKVIQNVKVHIENLKSQANKRLKVLVDNHSNDGQIKKMIISSMEGFKVIELKDIYYLEGDRNYTHFIINENKIIKRYTFSTKIVFFILRYAYSYNI